MERKRWMGTPPTTCNVCAMPITTEFYDMKTVAGPWAILCPGCALNGPGVGKLGTGYGQHYRQDADAVRPPYFKVET